MSQCVHISWRDDPYILSVYARATFALPNTSAWRACKAVAFEWKMFACCFPQNLDGSQLPQWTSPYVQRVREPVVWPSAPGKEEELHLRMPPQAQVPTRRSARCVDLACLLTALWSTVLLSPVWYLERIWSWSPTERREERENAMLVTYT